MYFSRPKAAGTWCLQSPISSCYWQGPELYWYHWLLPIGRCLYLSANLPNRTSVVQAGITRPTGTMITIITIIMWRNAADKNYFIKWDSCEEKMLEDLRLSNLSFIQKNRWEEVSNDYFKELWVSATLSHLMPLSATLSHFMPLYGRLVWIY